MKKFVAGMTILALVVFASPVSAHSWDDIDIDIDNDAYVYNDVDTTANTGSNDANGGSADSYVSSGNIDDDNWDSNTGNDDNDANGGNGGTNDTGYAWALSSVYNGVNYNDVDVDVECGCADDVDIDIDNDAHVYNYVDTLANTGGNNANGGSADSYVSSGNIDDDNWDSNTGNDDNDANGGNGGTNNTGDADSESWVVNVVNSNIVRVTFDD